MFLFFLGRFLLVGRSGSRRSMFSRLYRGLVGVADRVVPASLRPMWEHEAGPKTIFFWAPAMKWGLVIASLSDLSRPVEKLSVGQTASLAATGVIWSRYSLVIIPKNWSLFSVNFFVALSNLTQLGRIYQHDGGESKLAQQVLADGQAAKPDEELKQ